MKKLLILLVILLPVAKAEIILLEIKEEILQDLSSKIFIVFTTENISSFSIRINNIKSIESDICSLQNGIIVCNLPTLERKTYYLNVTKEKEEKNHYKLEVSISESVKKAFITIILPEGSFIKHSENLLPKPKFASDGRRIYVIYEFKDLQFFSTSFEIERTLPKDISTSIIVAIIFLISSLSIYLYFKFSSLKKYKEFLILLDENERKVLEILKKNPKIVQKKIVELTNLSKAKVSKIISSFKQRGIVEVERRGRNNIIKLIKKF
jgi:uncharacterized membrane protein